MLRFFNSRILGPLLPPILACVGLYLLIRCRFFLFRGPRRAIQTMLGQPGERLSSFRAACVALSGTLGVGNIAGVASAIAVGGAGAVFWMWIFGIFAMVIKYAEVVTAMSFREKGRGGVSYYLESGLHSRALGVLFALLVLFSSFSIGNIVQSSAASGALHVSLGIPSWLTGLLFAVVTYFLVTGGYERISRFSSVIIPLLSLAYVLLSVAILWKNASLLPSVWERIISDAFSKEALCGGGGGFLLGRAVRLGATRGILSNEAGCGTATYAHASTDCDAVRQGFWGVFEVFVDTILLCSLTAFTVLTVLSEPSASADGMTLAIDAYSVVGNWGGQFVAISSAIYALASVVCWSYYGTANLFYLGAKEKSRRLYLVVYSVAGWLGAISAPSLVWELTDLSITLMALINSVCLCLLAGIPAQATVRYLKGRD